MKILQLTTSLFMLLISAGAMAADLPRTGTYELAQADACQVSCRANADACRQQCSDPEEQTQCIVLCDKSDCKANCQKFEDGCKQRCQNPGG